MKTKLKPVKPVFTAEMLEAARSMMAEASAQRLAAIREAQAESMSDRVLMVESMFNPETIEGTYLPEEYRDVVESLDFNDRRFSYKKLRLLATKHYRDLGEANPASAFSQLFRVGVQTKVNDYYTRKATSWQNYVDETASGNRQEFYAPLWGSALPKQTGPGEPYSESQVLGQDIEIINVKFMGGESFDSELFDDDQTGQIQTRMQRLGEAARVLEEVYTAGRITGLAQTIAGVNIPASRWPLQKGAINSVGQAVATVFAQNMYDATHGNRPASFSQLSLPSFKAARVALLNALDPLGVKIAVDARCLLVSTQDTDNAAIMAHSEYYPAALGQAGGTQANAASGLMGQVFSKNPVLVAMIEPEVNIYLKDWAWYLGERKKGLMMQRRDPLAVVQEVPNSGNSFNYDTIRYRSRMRWEEEWVAPQFWFQGNDGSVTGAQ